MRQNFIAQFIQLLKHWLYNMWSDVVVERTLVPSVDQCQLQALKFLVYLNDLLSILRCNDSTRVQKAIVDQTDSRPPNNDHDLFLGASLALESALELLGPTSELVITGCRIQSTFCCTSQSSQEMVHCYCIE